MISVYRKQANPVRILYKKINDILGQIKDKYREAKILMAGDFNDPDAPKKIKDLVRSGP